MSYDPRQGQSPYLGMEDEYAVEDSSYTRASHATTNRISRSEADYSASYTNAYGTADVGTGAYTASTGTYVPQAVEVPKTIRRPSRAPQRAVAPRASQTAVAEPLRRPVPETPVKAVPSPSQQPYEYSEPAMPSIPKPRLGGPLGFICSLPVWLVGFGLRLGAIGLSFLVIATVFLTGSRRASLVGTLNLAPLFIPPTLLGQFVYETPFGGVLRGDLAIASVVLFVADWLCMNLSAALRGNY